MSDHFYAQRDDVKMRMARFPVPYASARWDALPARIYPPAVDAAWEWTCAWDNGGQPEKGLLLIGPPGRGKTLLATLALKDVILIAKQRGAFIASAQLVDWSMKSMSEGRLRDADANYLDACHDPDVVRCLLLDDAGKEHRGASDWAIHEVDRLIRNRFMGGAATIVTSNYGLKKWGEIYGDTMASFLHQAFEIVPMVTDHDLRKPVTD